jgi:hypothetical protein
MKFKWKRKKILNTETIETAEALILIGFLEIKMQNRCFLLPTVKAHEMKLSSHRVFICFPFFGRVLWDAIRLK